LSRHLWPIVIEDIDRLRSWAAAAPKGSTITWRRGDLAVDRRRHPQVDAMAVEVQRLARLGIVRAFRVEIRPSVWAHRVTKIRA
jgi:hypothetical protein